MTMSGTEGGGAPAPARDSLGALGEGALDWLGRNLEFFDPFSPSSPLPEQRRVKAALELAIVCHIWEKMKPATDVLDEARALLRSIWLRPELPQLIDTYGDRYANTQRLVYAALAPAGVRDDLREAVLARVRADGYLYPLDKSLLLQLETRYYAEKAELEHGIASYRELAEQSMLAKPPAPPVSTGDAYTITHTAFYLSDYGYRNPDIPGDVREQAEQATLSILDASVPQELWDLSGELVITLACLGADPGATATGRAGIRCLELAQLDSGAVPGRSAARRVDPSTPRGEFFRRAYHTTLVAVLMFLIAG
jgi:hypothetical protein